MRRERLATRAGRKAQTAIEYMLLLTICALIAFAGFRLFFQPGKRVRNGFELYFNNVSNALIGPSPNVQSLP